MIPKLIALDLDGTLLNSEKRISTRAFEILREYQRRGSEIVVCTGRPPRMALAYAEALGARYSVNFNGAVIFDVARQQVKEQFDMNAADALLVAEHLANLHPEFMGLFEASYGWFCNDAFHKHHYKNHPAELSTLEGAPHGIGPLGSFIDGHVSSFLLRHPELNSALLSKALKSFEVHCTWSGEHYLEVSAKGVHKLFALEKLCQELGVSASESLAFGNAHNDIEMLSWAGIGVAVSNASNDARVAATELTLSNDEDGVAVFLERYLS